MDLRKIRRYSREKSAVIPVKECEICDRVFPEKLLKSTAIYRGKKILLCLSCREIISTGLVACC